MNKQEAFTKLLNQNGVECQILRCVSNWENKNLIGIGENFGNNIERSYNTAICTSCAKVFEINEGDEIPKNGKKLLDEYYKLTKKT